MSEKAKRKSKQKNEDRTSPVIFVAIMLGIVFLLGLSIVFFLNYETASRTQMAFDLTATRIMSENQTRQVQIESSSTAAIINLTATAQANATPFP